MTPGANARCVSTCFMRPVKDNYRAQWPMDPTPPGFEDVPWLYRFDLPDQAANNYPLSSFPLPFDYDADFLFRGGWATAQSATNLSGSSLIVRLRDVYGHPLSDSYEPLFALFTPAPYFYGFGAGANRQTLYAPAPIEPELYCPLGSALSIDLNVLAGTPPGDSTKASLFLYGVKRYKGCAR